MDHAWNIYQSEYIDEAALKESGDIPLPNEGGAVY
jgi:hypothetical protein